MKEIMLVISTILTVLFIIFLLGGNKYEKMITPLSGDAFPFKSIYTIGLFMQDIPVFQLRGTLEKKLLNDATLLYSKKYSAYYAKITWAQVLSVGMFALTTASVLSVLLGESAMGFCIAAGMGVSALFTYLFLNYMNDQLNDRRSFCEKEFTNAMTKLALMVNSGIILRQAWDLVAYGKEGEFYDLMRLSSESMRNGVSDIEAIHDFGVLTNSDSIKKFMTTLVQNLERGGGDLPIFLVTKSKELWEEKKQHMLQEGEKAASRLLMPIALMFFGIMLIIIASIMQSFSFSL